ncbi:hypothetical protein R1flu_018034 [Riccia fluitans]|uniref:Uncharacterized protein n=1 Tax=Riccia fluitans TaxID=41844 RepID=A0ABD1ZEN1_9MARC
MGFVHEGVTRRVAISDGESVRIIKDFEEGMMPCSVSEGGRLRRSLYNPIRRLRSQLPARISCSVIRVCSCWPLSGEIWPSR